MSQRSYENAKFYKAMRHRLESMDLPASSIALLIAAHTICDADTGRFYRDDVTFRNILKLSKSTVSHAFKRLLQSGLVEETTDGYIIVNYEEDRLQQPSYFRISPALLTELSNMVAHHNPRIILFALELLDRKRVRSSEIVYGMRTLIRHWKLGTCPARVYRSLQLLGRVVMWAQVPNSSGTGYNLHFYPTKDEERSTEQNRYRSLHGKVSGATKHGYDFAKGTNAFTWRELARTTRLILEYGIQCQLSSEVMCQVGSLFGAYCARSGIQHKTSYLRRALPDLVHYIDQLEHRHHEAI